MLLNRKKGSLKWYHVYSLFFKILYDAFGRLTFIKRISIKTPSCLSKKKNANPKTQTPYFLIESSYSLWLPPLRCNSIDTQIRIVCSKPISIRKKKIQKKKKKLLSSSATVKTEKFCSSSATTGDSEDNSEGKYVFFSPFWFNYHF